MRKLAIHYFKKGIELAEKDLKVITDEQNKYIDVDVYDKRAIKGYLKMQKAE